MAALICIGLSCLLPVMLPAAEQVTLQLRWDHQFQFAGYYAAKWQGFYEAEGLDVEIKSAISPDTILSAVEEVGSGRAQFGIGGADILKKRDEGTPLVVVAAIFQHSAAAFYTRKDQQITAPADFLRLRVARRVNDLIDIELQAMLIAEGIDPNRVRAYKHQPGMDHLTSGEVDVAPGYSINFPYTAGTKGVKINEFRPIKYGIDFYGDSLFTHQNVLDTNPDLVSRFKSASIRGWQYALENPEEMITYISNELDRSRTIDDLEAFNRYQHQGMVPLVNFLEVELGHINPVRWERMHHYLKEIGILKQEVDLDGLIYNPGKMAQAASEKRQRFLLSSIIIALGCLAVIGFWTFFLKIRVKKKTAELIQANEKLETSEKKYRQLVELAQEGIWAIDEENRTTFVNQSMAAMLGYQVDEMIGAGLFSFMDEEGVRIAKENLDRRKQGIAEQHDFAFRKKNGQRMYAALATSPILDENGRYQGALAGVIDLTGRREAEQEKRGLEIQLFQSQKMEAIGTLAGGIAHDFNNILSSIIGFTELAADTAEKGSEQKENLDEVLTAGIRAKNLVKQILAYARQSGGEIKPVRLQTVISDTLKLLRPSTPTTIEIKTSLVSTSFIMANPSQIDQVVLNLCANAVQAMDTDGGILDVQLRDIRVGGDTELADGDYVEMIISDNGVGIDPLIIGRVFDPYFTTRATGEGTGMGLAVVKGIVESSGGTITIFSEPGRGTRCLVRLPATGGTEENAGDENTVLETGSEQVLLIDDEPAIARMAGKMLESLGYRVTRMTSSREGLDLFREKPDDFDLVITDMTMPEMTGDALSIELLGIRKDVPIILLTGYSNQIDEARATAIGIKAFAYKPLTKLALASTVREVLDSSAVPDSARNREFDSAGR